MCSLCAHAGALDAAAFSGDDAALVTVGRDAQRRALVVVWDVAMLRSGAGGKSLLRMHPERHTGIW